MPVIGIEFDCDEDEAIRRSSDHGAVTDDGNYYREMVVDVVPYQQLRNFAEQDDDATIMKVEL